jgi:hypothetical protein
MVWDELSKIVKPFIDNNPNYSFDETKRTMFDKNYQEFRDKFTNFYMKNNILKQAETDRHKNAAIIVCALNKTIPVTYKNDHPNKKIIINEMLSVNLALSYMYSSLCELIDEYKDKKNGCPEIGLNREELAYISKRLNDENEQQNGYCLPVSFANHNERYADILASEIYYAKEANQLFPVTLANVFFLIESFSIQSLKTDFYKEKCGL